MKINGSLQERREEVWNELGFKATKRAFILRVPYSESISLTYDENFMLNVLIDNYKDCESAIRIKNNSYVRMPDLKEYDWLLNSEQMSQKNAIVDSIRQLGFIRIARDNSGKIVYSLNFNEIKGIYDGSLEIEEEDDDWSDLEIDEEDVKEDKIVTPAQNNFMGVINKKYADNKRDKNGISCESAYDDKNIHETGEVYR